MDLRSREKLGNYSFNPNLLASYLHLRTGMEHRNVFSSRKIGLTADVTTVAVALSILSYVMVWPPDSSLP